jgi:hypothetical protein
MARYYHLHDLCIRASSDHPDVVQMLDRTLRYKGAEASSNPEAADLSLTFSVGTALPSVPDTARHLGQSEHGHIDVWMADERMMLHHPEAGVLIDLHDGSAAASITPDLLAARDGQRRDPLFYLITFSLVILLRYRGWFALHTAALAREGHGLLLVAQSDSGKSTATMNLVRQGWDYLSDDTVLLRTESERARAYSFRRNFCVDPDATALFPELARREWPASLSDATKWQVDVDALFPGQYAPTAIPRVLVLPQITSAPKSRIEPVDAKTVLGHLIEQGALFLTPDPAVAEQHLNVFRRLIQQSQTYRLYAARDLLDKPHRTHELLAPLLRNASAAASG